MQISEEIKLINHIVWGSNHIKSDIFKRWCQGFYFSKSEPCALEQVEGGPCAIIATLQALIVRNVLFEHKKTFNNVTYEENFDLLITAMSDILQLVKKPNSPMKFYFWCEVEEETASNDSQRDLNVYSKGLQCAEADNKTEIQGLMLSLQENLSHEFGLLCFLYSVLQTYGPDRVSKAMENETETLIDPTHGHASQCLINLLITGKATPYLFDGERDLGGYCLEGVSKQPDIGFLTIFEASSYCEVGWFLKNPAFPIWVLGSETHFTVVASSNTGLVHKEVSDPTAKIAPLRTAEIEFTKMSNGDESGFIMSDKLEELMRVLRINCDNEQLQTLKRELDPEQLGLILREPFLQHFYPAQMSERKCRVSEFQLIHVNALQRSNTENAVRFHKGDARLVDPEEELVNRDLPSDRSDIQRCLETKWPTIKIKWESGHSPSIN